MDYIIIHESNNNHAKYLNPTYNSDVVGLIYFIEFLSSNNISLVIFVIIQIIQLISSLIVINLTIE
ncbi:transmembrane protein, putative (macronuclear) [Tetrahymena thermophila SB210]|uniref:Transmembrane protein, putative n=1 Tax=Tetrahymena thermophila (strain SB210) TaxID=312017 RepID=I7MEW9_TETTS|nr:transmembrane protein, putative [Tetrahymena thermophila SB210]EAR97951.1 transmembrane protein, putative [Tetrahymena thermophila SB210]|eukprot:XP_001018196.1 transmembrane protein, putative [Tetrahymena thermophila SB210]